ncbi:DNA/RNA non-specific endonuclease [Arthrobacter sedimenti]|uniref:DNA/RNA non-specific endonuclease n=1 Tax=Arthrobacter sedimenti TaxID=2694931 RepID=A0ABV8WNB7_9MICC
MKTVLLPYTHFSVLMRPDKRLAAVTALMMEGKKLIDLARAGIPWRLDPRIPADEQTGEQVYANKDIDLGHLVRRASAVWGDTKAEAAQANEDTFHYTNAAPQAAKFKQGAELWLGLESYLQENAADNSQKITVFTGPVFDAKDPIYRGVDIPLKFFKVAVFLYQGELAATGYVVDQTEVLADLPDLPKPRVTEEPAPPGQFRTFQVPIRDIAALTGLERGAASGRGPDAHRSSTAQCPADLNLAGPALPRRPRPGLRPPQLTRQFKEALRTIGPEQIMRATCSAVSPSAIRCRAVFTPFPLPNDR